MPPVRYRKLPDVWYYTDRAVGGNGGQQDSEQSPPGGSDQQRRDENAGRHRQAVRPTGQEEVGQSEQAQSQRIVASCKKQIKKLRERTADLNQSGHASLHMNPFDTLL